MRMKMALSGLGAFNDKLDRLARFAPKVSAKRVAKTAYAIDKRAKKNASGRPGPNVITGRLRSNIGVEFFNAGQSAEIGTSVYYAPHVEYGTLRTRPYPFLWPALQTEKPEFVKGLADDLKRELKEEWNIGPATPKLNSSDWFVV